MDRGILLLGSCLLSQARVGALGSPLVLVSSPLNWGHLIKSGVSSKNPLGEETEMGVWRYRASQTLLQGSWVEERALQPRTQLSIWKGCCGEAGCPNLSLGNNSGP